MINYWNRRRRIVGMLFSALLLGLVGGLAALVGQPDARAAALGAGRPLHVWFTVNPVDLALRDEDCQLCVELTSPAGNRPQKVYLYYPLKMNKDKCDPKMKELQCYEKYLWVRPNEKEGCIDVTPLHKGWVAVVAKSNGGRAGGVLEVQYNRH